MGREEHGTGQWDSSCLGISLTGSPRNCHGREKMQTIAVQEQSAISGQKNQEKLRIPWTQTKNSTQRWNWGWETSLQFYEWPKKAVSSASPTAKNPKLSCSWNKETRSIRLISVSKKDKAVEKVSLWHTGTGVLLTRNSQDTQCPFHCQELLFSIPVSEPPLRVCGMKAVLKAKGGQSRGHEAHSDTHRSMESQRIHPTMMKEVFGVTLGMPSKSSGNSLLFTGKR